MHTRYRAVMVALVSLAFTPVPARAESPAPETASVPSAQLPDVVRLKNGAYFRGTIVESIPNESVTLIAADGTTKRFAATEIEYAGKADAQPHRHQSASEARPDIGASIRAQMSPGAGASTAPASSELVQVEFTSTPSGLTFYERTDVVTTVWSHRLPAHVEPGYRIICTTPCRAGIAPGEHPFAMARSGSPPEEDAPLVIDAQHTHVYGGYVRNKEKFAAGFAVMGIGAAAGISLIAIGAHSTQQCAGSFCDSAPYEPALIAAGGALLLLGGSVGWFLVANADRTKISLQPFATVHSDAAPRTQDTHGQEVLSSRQWLAPAHSNGLALSLSF